MSSFFHLWRVLSAKFFKLCAKTDVFAFRPEITCAVRDAHSKDHRTGFNKKNSKEFFFSSLASPICKVFQTLRKN